MSTVTDYMMLGWVGPAYTINNIGPNQQMDLVPNATFYSSPNNNLQYNNVSGFITLMPGKAYRLTASISGRFMQNNGFSFTYQWVDSSNNPLTPNAEAVATSHNGAVDGTQASVNDIIYVPPSTAYVVKLRVLCSSGAFLVLPCRSSIVVESIY